VRPWLRIAVVGDHFRPANLNDLAVRPTDVLALGMGERSAGATGRRAWGGRGGREPRRDAEALGPTSVGVEEHGVLSDDHALLSGKREAQEGARDAVRDLFG
jgi:hypothetical protein